MDEELHEILQNKNDGEYMEYEEQEDTEANDVQVEEDIHHHIQALALQKDEDT